MSGRELTQPAQAISNSGWTHITRTSISGRRPTNNRGNQPQRRAYAAFARIRQALWPPKPKLFDNTIFIGTWRA